MPNSLFDLIKNQKIQMIFVIGFQEMNMVMRSNTNNLFLSHTSFREINTEMKLKLILKN